MSKSKLTNCISKDNFIDSTAVVCHDAGGAEILASWVSKYPCNYNFVLEGPAINIFRRKLGNIIVMPLEKAITNSNRILCGTSWQSDLERIAIRLAKLSGKHVVSFLDHWVNYRERFHLGESYLFPDEIWVGDYEGLDIAKKKIKETKIILKKNPYFEELEKKFEKAKINDLNEGISILYVCEPISAHALFTYGNDRHWGYTEIDAILYFLENIHLIDRQIKQIKIRPHPSEHIDKYHWLHNYNQHPIILGGTQHLTDEIIESDVIVGCQSMAMVAGLIARKRVICSIPPYGQPCQLPHKAIEKLSNLKHQH